MRKDMSKRFLVSRSSKIGKFPRHCKKFNQTDEDGEYLHSPQGMRKVHRLTVKYEDHGYTGTDFSVLHRFLRSRVGQPWDKVYSEICAEADLRSFPGHHLREWLEYEVEQNCTLDDNGEVRDHRGHRIQNSYSEEFYVHPKTGILEYDGRRKRKPQTTTQTVFEMDGMLYHEHQGIWYRVRMQELKKRPSRFLGNSYMVYDEWDGLNDVMLKGLDSSYPWQTVHILEKEYGHSPNGIVWYCTWKQSANSKEIAKLKKRQAA